MSGDAVHLARLSAKLRGAWFREARGGAFSPVGFSASAQRRRALAMLWTLRATTFLPAPALRFALRSRTVRAMSFGRSWRTRAGCPRNAWSTMRSRCGAVAGSAGPRERPATTASPLNRPCPSPSRGVTRTDPSAEPRRACAGNAASGAPRRTARLRTRPHERRSNAGRLRHPHHDRCRLGARGTWVRFDADMHSSRARVVAHAFRPPAARSARRAGHATTRRPSGRSCSGDTRSSSC